MEARAPFSLGLQWPHHCRRWLGATYTGTSVCSVLARCNAGAVLGASQTSGQCESGVSLARLWIEVREGERRHGASHPTGLARNLHEIFL